MEVLVEERVFLYPSVLHNPLRSIKTLSSCFYLVVPPWFWRQPAAASLVTFRRLQRDWNYKARVSGASFLLWSDVGIQGGRRRRRCRHHGWHGSLDQCVSCSFVWWVNSSASLSGNTFIFSLVHPTSKHVFAIMKDIYSFTNTLNIFPFEVFILLKARPVFTCSFLPVDQRQTHKMIKTPVHRLTLAAPWLLFKSLFS